MTNKILIAEISGKRPGGVNKRHTESFKFDYDHVIISNNSEATILIGKLLTCQNTIRVGIRKILPQMIKHTMLL